MKVHFAGMENIDFGLTLHAAGVRYGLWSIFPYISNDFGVTNSAFTAWPEELHNIFELFPGDRMIMDSGLFSLMFGSTSKKMTFDEDFMVRWTDRLIEFVLEVGYKGTVVEVDCQKTVSVELAWKLRKRMFEKLPNQLMSVFHVEDGIGSGLKKMVDFSDYIAISVPEWRRLLKQGSLLQHIVGLVHEIRRLKSHIKIHLLGCTQKDLLKTCAGCTTCDSTSWLQVNVFGTGRLLWGPERNHLSRKNIEVVAASYLPQMRELQARYPKCLPEKRDMQYYANYLCNAIHLRKHYSTLCGDQS